MNNAVNKIIIEKRMDNARDISSKIVETGINKRIKTAIKPKAKAISVRFVRLARSIPVVIAGAAI